MFLWAGLAKMAGGPVYAGMVDAEYARTVSPLGAAVLVAATADFFQETLMKGNYDIFDDLAWQFRAYQASGIWALRHVDAKHLDTPAIRPLDLSFWNDLWAGECSGSAALVQGVNYAIIDREQQHIVQRAWTDFKTYGVTGIQFLLNILANSPLGNVVPDADSFWVVVGPTKDITEFADRWEWIDDSTDGIWHDWTGLSISTRTGLVTIPLKTRAEHFSWFHWIGYPIIW